MLDKIKLAFFDLDGTLTNKDLKISYNNIKALEYLKSKNIKIVFSSGRWDTYILNPEYPLELVDYIICNNGCETYDLKEKKLILNKFMNKDTVKYLINYCNNMNIQITLNSFFKRFNNEITETEIINNPIYLGVIICKSKNEVNKIIADLKDNNELYISYISSSYFKEEDTGRYTLNISIKNIDKGYAVKNLQKHLNITKDESICFGDNNNDISMFNNCGISVAMENGYPLLKAQATYITKSNNDDGVAYFIDNYL